MPGVRAGSPACVVARRGRNPQVRPRRMNPTFRGVLLFALVWTGAWAADSRPRNVVLVTLDGLRWQEVFRGAEEALITRVDGGVPANQLETLRRDFWADTPEERRRKLL